MTGELWLEIMDRIDPDLVERAVLTERRLTRERGKRRRWVRWASAAACLCLFVGTVIGVASGRGESAPVGEGITIPQAQVNLKKPTDGIADIAGLFIYGGRVYRQFQWVENPSIVGKYVATVTGLIDEWTKADGYVELAGTAPGDIYTVNGFDPDFMLCQTQGDSVCLFVCNNGLTLYTGEDWFGDIFRLRRDLESVACENWVSYVISLDRKAEIRAEHRKLIRRLVKALYDTPLMHAMDVPSEGKYGTSINENSLYTLYFHLDNGITLTLRLYRGGYLTHGAVAVKLEESLYRELLAVLGESCGEPWYLESADILACTGEDIFVDFFDLPGNIHEAGVQSKMSWYGEYKAPAPLDEEGIVMVYRLIDELRDTPAVHQDEMLAHQGWERVDDGMWYWISLPSEMVLILHEGGWVRMGYTYPLTFRAEGEAFDALWALCEQLTE